MADITMCKGTNCPVMDKCYRANANPDKHRQSYFVEPPFNGKNCDYFWGDNAENIFKTLKSIVNGKEK